MIAVIVALSILYVVVGALNSGPGAVDHEPVGRDDSPAAIHRRILVLDGWLGAGALPCGRPDNHLDRWKRDEIDSGIWWIRSHADLASLSCWAREHRAEVTIATRAGDAPRLHTAGRRTIYIGALAAGRDDLAGLHAQGVRFARAPATGTLEWIAQARASGIAVDVADVPRAVTATLLSVNAPAMIFGWRRDTDAAPDGALMATLGNERGGVMLMLPGATGVDLDDMLACLRYLPWSSCAIGGATDPRALTIGLLRSGYSEGNVARMFGFDLLRVLRDSEVRSNQR